MIEAIKNWWQEYRALHPERRMLVTTAMLCVLVAYFIVSTMSQKRGEMEGQSQVIAALPRIAPVAVELIREACRVQWTANEWESDCALFFALREQRAH